MCARALTACVAHEQIGVAAHDDDDCNDRNRPAPLTSAVHHGLAHATSLHRVHCAAARPRHLVKT
jgi:hypothetical protein